MITGIIFDLDGTLVDSIADITQAMNRAFREMSLPPVTESQVEPALGHGARELVSESIRAVDARRLGDGALVDTVLDFYLDAYAAEPASQTSLYADAATALPKLHATGLKLGICTNKSTALSQNILRAVGIGDLFSAVRGRDLTDHPKPDPRHLLETVATLGLFPDNVIYVGDNPVDVAVGRRADVVYRHVAWGVPVDDDVIKLERFSDLLAIDS